ncbi:MAG: DEAD/DEAH box helicase family protein [Candidatus Gracilibacteria bacterium]|nr:DEAD/DEAH box helicase family protein [Candidatus Gracilibacteria bacterium]
MGKEAKARIKINKMLEEKGWRFEDEGNKKSNIQVETNIKISDIGEDFENISNGFIDYLLLDNKGFPICVLEAKSEDKDPLVGKEQARIYANSQNIRFIILSNGNIHYFWDKEIGNPTRISHFPSLESLQTQTDFKPDKSKIINELVDIDYIVKTQLPSYKDDPKWSDEQKKYDFIKDKGLRFLRKYQIKAINSIQQSIANGKNRFLFEMATGTGKTLTSAGVIKLFLKTGMAKRVLFLVDRLELEEQAKKAFIQYLGNDFQTIVFKENKDNWNNAEIVVTTIQSISYNDKYLKLFSPSDFDLIISDEAHRSISGSNRVIFEYFLAYKLGLTATPKDYLKNIDKAQVAENDPRNLEKRQLLSTYHTFGCDSGEPTFRYSLLDGVRDVDGPFLVNPITLNCKTDITTELLSKEGYSVELENEDGDTEEVVYKGSSFERKFFSETTNEEFCKAYLQNALTDPISGEIGKTIFFCVSRSHASKITQLLNKLAMEMYPGKYNSDFALQITSDISSAQQFTINFANGNLNGYTNFLEGYKSSKTRVCVTVGMMTTGYDCQDLLNVCLARPIFSPSDFVQIKGRGTRTFTFEYKGLNQTKKEIKQNFKLFDFFENCKYFEEDYPYDKILELPKKGEKTVDNKPNYDDKTRSGTYEETAQDRYKIEQETIVGLDGMRIDREMIGRFENTMKKEAENSPEFRDALVSGDYNFMEDYIKTRVFDRPNDFFNLSKLREGYKTDRKVGLWEIIDFIFFGKSFKTKDQIAEEEFEKFSLLNDIESDKYNYIKEFFKYYLLDESFRTLVNAKNYREFAGNPEIMEIFRTLGKDKLEKIPEFIQDNVVLNKFY